MFFNLFIYLSVSSSSLYYKFLYKILFHFQWNENDTLSVFSMLLFVAINLSFASGCTQWNFCHATSTYSGFLHGISSNYWSKLYWLFDYWWGKYWSLFCSYLNGKSFVCHHIDFNFIVLPVCLAIEIFTHIFRKTCSPSPLLLCEWL